MAEEIDEEGAKNSSSKMMIIIIALVVILGGAAYFFMFMGDDTAAVEPEQTSIADDNTLYFTIKNPFFIDFSTSENIKMLQISVALSVDNEETIGFLVKHEPMIRNNFLMLIRGKVPEDLYTSEGKEMLKAALVEEMENIIKKMGGRSKYDVKSLFFTSFVMQ